MWWRVILKDCWDWKGCVYGWRKVYCHVKTIKHKLLGIDKAVSWWIMWKEKLTQEKLKLLRMCENKLVKFENYRCYLACLRISVIVLVILSTHLKMSLQPENSFSKWKMLLRNFHNNKMIFRQIQPFFKLTEHQWLKRSKLLR